MPDDVRNDPAGLWSVSGRLDGYKVRVGRPPTRVVDDFDQACRIVIGPETDVPCFIGRDVVDKAIFRDRRQGGEVRVIGMNQAARTLVERVGRFETMHLPADEAAH